jgi:hypothetical protein
MRKNRENSEEKVLMEIQIPSMGHFDFNII